ncbi:MAG: molybdopterin converting factor subunit 1 [Candidatus Dormibacteria bacterium]
MRVKVRLFASVREAAGWSESEVAVADGSDLNALWAELVMRHPALAPLRDALVVAVQREYTEWTAALHDGDEVALIPPVSGGSPRIRCRLLQSPLDPLECEQFVREPEAGGVCRFTGWTRASHEGREVLRLEYEAYPEMAVPLMERIAEAAAAHHPGVHAIAVDHRLGEVPVGECAVVVSVSAVHRDEAFLACREVIDRVKQSVPIFKRQWYRDGSRWVEGA